MDQEIKKIIKEQVHILYEGDKIKRQIDESYDILFEFLGFGKKQQPNPEEFRQRVEDMVGLITSLESHYKQVTGQLYNNLDARKKISAMLNNPSKLKGTPYEDPQVRNDIIKIIREIPELKRQHAKMDQMLRFQYNINMQDTHKPPVPIST